MSQPIALIVGMPRSFEKRLQPIARNGWHIEQIFSTIQQPDLTTCKPAIMRHMSDATCDGVHIFAFHKAENARPQLRRYFGDFQRLSWIPNSLVASYGTSAFDNGIQTFLEFEEQWRIDLRPLSHGDVLILPETAFAAKGIFGALWQRTREISPDFDEIDRLKKFTDEFARDHVAPDGIRGYVDRNHRVFKFDGARHGTIDSSSMRSWKFKRCIGNDFHFDVQQGAAGRTPVSVTDAEGNERTFATHANMDMFGYIRGEAY
jgi:hypothetical protein